jgi:hypothetical protein
VTDNVRLKKNQTVDEKIQTADNIRRVRESESPEARKPGTENLKKKF